MQQIVPIITPAPGENLKRFVGDRVRFTARFPENQAPASGWTAKLRTNLGRAEILTAEMIQAHAGKLPFAGASWHDLPMTPDDDGWSLELPLIEPGYFKAKAYLLDPQGWQHWPFGADAGISVHPDSYRSGNTIYCAFTRMFGPSRTATRTDDEKLAATCKSLDDLGYTVIPPSGKFRDLVKQLPHIVDTLGCRVIHLLPVNPTPTTYARFGRFGSPYACEDLTAIDPALVEFDKRATAVDQFRELTYATHLRGARVFIDMVINHTGWGSTLQDNHPEWFLREPGGDFASPGAWGTTWEDLVELKQESVALWECLAEVFLTWCSRGVDGFRCDAGYKVPLAAWRYIIARVRREFPETVFLLEGLGGSWEVTAKLLTEGGMQWAYSELFQNYSGREVASYLDYATKQSENVGLFVHYSETHDNDRLAQRGRAWSLLRNRLCALTSVSGGYGFTCGVEWLAPERVNVHSSRGLAWDNPDNIVPELARLIHLLNEHPCFFESAKLTRLSEIDSPIFALHRDSADGKDGLLVLANNDTEKSQTIKLPFAVVRELGELKFELTGQPLPKSKSTSDAVEYALEPGGCYCLSASAVPRGLGGEAYRHARAQAAWAMTALGKTLPIEKIPAMDWRHLARLTDENPSGVLAAASMKDPECVKLSLERLLAAASQPAPERYQPVVTWTLADQRRITCVPPAHWLLLQDPEPFRATLSFADGRRAQQIQAIGVQNGHAACFEPNQTPGDGTLTVERYAAEGNQVIAQIRFLASGPDLHAAGDAPLALPDLSALRQVAAHAAENKSAPALNAPLVLLTNGIGGMARLVVDFGAIKSKYDCLLAANLNPRVPVDRHVFAKRARLWVNADGFITALDMRNLISFEPGPPAIWHFLANAGDGRTVEIAVSAVMLPERNTTVLRFSRPAPSVATDKSLPPEHEVRLTVRVDIEDRNFHSETKRNSGTDYHFSSNTHTLDKAAGFAFTPAPDRQMRVFSTGGIYHDQPEWAENIPHPVEQSRGQTGSGDAYSPGWFELPLAQGESISVIACADATDPSAKEIQNLTPASGGKKSSAKEIFPTDDAFGRQLLRAASDFVVRRDDGVTVIAGYPWFLDWGRDSLICARGLLAAGMTDRVKQLLITFGRFEKDGTLPNTIHGDDASNRDTSDAPLWYGIVCEELAAQSGKDFYQSKVDAAGRTLADVLVDIATHYASGTPNGIRMDVASGLIWSPSHFTWMDTNFPAGTPREGYPIEIQVLWIRLLRQLEKIVKDGDRWKTLADLAQNSLLKYYWLEEPGYFADVLFAKAGQPASEATVENALRSNYLFAVSLGLVSGDQAQRCVEAARRYLVVPGALRTLAPLPVSPPLAVYGNQGQLLNYPPEPYWGHYEGDEDTRRKPAYHNGTAWTWTFPVFCEALAKAWDNSPEAIVAAKAYLGSIDRLMLENCVGQIPEILDGDAPHTQRGCDAQAWGVTEALRVWKLLTANKK